MQITSWYQYRHQGDLRNVLPLGGQWDNRLVSIAYKSLNQGVYTELNTTFQPKGANCV